MTTADDVIQSFESTFADKTPLPDSLVFQWLKRQLQDILWKLMILHLM